VSSHDVFVALTRATAAGRPVVMGTTVGIEGDPPSAAGNRALFDAAGNLVAGTIGCNGLDRSAGADGRELLAAGESSAVRSYRSFGDAPGSGRVDVFLEVFTGRATLVVGGRGPVADDLGRLGSVVGIGVVAQADIGGPGFAAAVDALGPADAVVFIDHDDPGIAAALETVLRGQAGYIGVMGSRRHTHGFIDGLAAAGHDLGRVYSPTGLDVGAKSPPEIALSILAEVVAVTRGKAGGPMNMVGH
jgi:xanthine dehydrogenase accessory factor